MPSCVVPRSTFPGLPEDSAGPIDSRSVLLTCAALCLVVVLIYTTIDQMRPSAIIEAIRVHVLDAREKQLPLLKATRRRVSSETPDVVTRRVMSERHGYVTAIDVGEIARSVANAKSGHDESIQCGPNIEVALRVVLGSYVACRDLLAELRCGDPLADTQNVENSVIAAIILENERDLECDPDLGIAQLAIIDWTSISTARSTRTQAFWSVMYCAIFLRWLEQGAHPEDLSSRIVYEDRVPGAVIATLESLSVAASESMQHQTLAEILRTFGIAPSQTLTRR